MNDNFFDGLDELYHRAKFGEDCLLVRRKKNLVVSGNPTDPSFYPPTLKILWTYLC